MKIAIDTSPLKSGHNQRGIGFYTQNLVDNLVKYDKANQYLFFDDGKIPACDLVHYPYFDLYFHTLPINRTVPAIVTIHDLIPLVYPQYFPVGLRGKFNFWLQKRALKSISRVICDSQNSKNDAIKYLSLRQDKIDVVYLAPNEVYQPSSGADCILIKRKYELPDEFVLYVGDVNYNKNLINLIRAMTKVESNLVMIGSALVDAKLPEVRVIVSEMRKLGVSRKIRRLGFVPSEELVAIYNLASLYVQPSFYEGFGLPVVEAMACGTPVVVSKCSSLPEITGEVAFFTNPQEPESIANSINKVLEIKNEDFKDYQLLKRKSIEQSKLFSWEKTALETIKSYEAVLES